MLLTSVEEANFTSNYELLKNPAKLGYAFEKLHSRFAGSVCLLSFYAHFLFILHLGLYRISMQSRLAWVEAAFPQKQELLRNVGELCSVSQKVTHANHGRKMFKWVLSVCLRVSQVFCNVPMFVYCSPPMALCCVALFLFLLAVDIAFRSLQDLNANTCVLGGRNPFLHRLQTSKEFCKIRFFLPEIADRCVSDPPQSDLVGQSVSFWGFCIDCLQFCNAC